MTTDLTAPTAWSDLIEGLTLLGKHPLRHDWRLALELARTVIREQP